MSSTNVNVWNGNVTAVHDFDQQAGSVVDMKIAPDGSIGLGETEWLTVNAMKSAFAPFDERLRIINEVVKPGYARLRAREARVVAAG